MNVEHLEENCFEMQVQCYLNQIWQSIYNHLDQIPKITQTQRDIQYQVRLQKMLAFIHQNYMNPVSLQDISISASISISEASRCFHSFLNCSPIEYLLKHRIESSKSTERIFSLPAELFPSVISRLVLGSFSLLLI